MRILGVLFLALAPAAFGGGIGPDIGTLPLCDSVSVLSDLTTSDGCAIEPFSIFNASFSAPSGSPVTGADDIAVGITYGGGNLAFSFGGSFFLPEETTNPPGYAEYIIQYTIDPPPPVILGFEMDAEWSDWGSGFRIAGLEFLTPLVVTPVFEVFTDLCVGGNFGRNGECATESGYGPLFLDPNQLFDGVSFELPTNWVSVRHRIQVYQSINLQVNNRAPLDESPVPEPGTWALMAVGLAALAFRRR